MPDPSELIFPDEPVFSPPVPPPAPKRPRPPMMPPTPPICRMEGMVRNRFLFPQRNVRVALYTSLAGNAQPIREERTDRLGRFSFSRIRPGRYFLVATDRFSSGRRTVRLTPNNCYQTNLVILLS